MKTELKVQNQQEESSDRIKESISDFSTNMVRWLRQLRKIVEQLIRKTATKIQIYKSEKKLLKKQAEFGVIARKLILKNSPEWIEQNPRLSELVSTIDQLLEDIQLLKENLEYSDSN